MTHKESYHRPSWDEYFFRGYARLGKASHL